MRAPRGRVIASRLDGVTKRATLALVQQSSSLLADREILPAPEKRRGGVAVSMREAGIISAAREYAAAINGTYLTEDVPPARE